ncbi:hypothetical protein [Methylobacterium sp. Leaf118]|uniref:hypothetical protein n=1 Tax=Methylobacterium sp. Leaf118 TaxID=2876562 RepID=UPI001E6086FD|nr:hypothetical protein [Methylobacterium sp. Leaf118]
MARIHILTNPRSDAGTFLPGIGDWVPSLPLANLKTQQPKQVARSTSLDASATRFAIDLGSQWLVPSFALINSNLTRSSKVRIRVSNNADGYDPILDVTVPGVPPNIAWGSLPWGQFPWNGYRDDALPAGQVTFFQASKSVFGRYVLVNITDPNNPAGYVQIGRFMGAAAFVPRYNMAYGAALKWIDETRVSKSVGGQKWFDVRPNFRSFRASFNFATQGEALGAVYDMQQRVGLSGNLLVIYDPEDSADVILRRTIYGSLTELSEIVTANETADTPYAWTLAVEELI